MNGVPFSRRPLPSIAPLLLPFLSLPAAGQPSPLPQHVEPLALDSGPLDNPGSAPAVVWSRFLDFGPNAHWARFLFSVADLPEGSAVRVTSLLDGESQVLDASRMQEWKLSSAYLNGAQFAIQLLAGPGTQGNRLVVRQAFVGDPPAALAAPPEDICGAIDDRLLTVKYSICRLLLGVTVFDDSPNAQGCTGFLIDVPPGNAVDQKCLLSAGHCFVPVPQTNFQIATVAQFNVPLSNADCTMNHPSLLDQYPVTAVVAAAVGAAGVPGNDYAVFRTGRNSANQTAFQRQNALFAAHPGPGAIFGPVPFSLAKVIPANGTSIRVAGYGVDSTDFANAAGGNGSCNCPLGTMTGTWNQVLQADTGTLATQVGDVLTYVIDTCGANSGSPILHETTKKVIGIHTAGGCVMVGDNAGTKITKPALQAAIAACFPPPATLFNDECAASVPLADGLNAGFTNVSATNSLPAWPCGAGGKDVWFSYQPICSGTFTFDTCTPGTNFDTTLQVLGGTCANPVSLGCNDDSCGVGSSVTVNLVAGNLFYVRVGGHSSAVGLFDVRVASSCPPPGVPCVVFSETFEGGGLGAYAETDAAGAAAATLWHGEALCDAAMTPIPASMGANAAAYNRGDLGLYDYDTAGTPNGGAIESPVIPSSVVAALRLSFQYTKETEGAGTAAFDQCFVEARPAGGAYATVAQVVGNTPCTPAVSFAVNLPQPSGGPWQHRFRFETIDGSMNGYRGWYVDNVVATQHVTTGGAFLPVATGCGTLAIQPAGVPVLGSNVNFALENVQGFPLMWVGAPILIPLCPPIPCALGASFGALVPGAQILGGTLPCDPSAIGQTFGVQGADVGNPGGCGAATFGVPFALSPTILTTIG
ncbi:MAG TPA: hypothetical protein VFI25_05720 [Planctomycetota bacterium]|jgi:hypothetical protein|nr:hypothetical protein [Planctomycetota bacterium]